MKLQIYMPPVMRSTLLRPNVWR